MLGEIFVAVVAFVGGFFVKDKIMPNAGEKQKSDDSLQNVDSLKSQNAKLMSERDDARSERDSAKKEVENMREKIRGSEDKSDDVADEMQKVKRDNLRLLSENDKRNFKIEVQNKY